MNCILHMQCPCPGKVLLRCLFALVLLVAYNEFLIYYVMLVQCQWPLPGDVPAYMPASRGSDALKVMMLADTHLLGPRGHWFDKLRREWQMERAFQTAMTLHMPDVVFVLGDLLDEGELVDDARFADDTSRFYRLFRHEADTRLIAIVGNHDVGFHYRMTPRNLLRFRRVTKSSKSVGLVVIRGVPFVTVNSMAFEGDNCQLCTEAQKQLLNVSARLECDHAKAEQSLCTPEAIGVRPILLQHFPMYRKSDGNCSGPDAANEHEKHMPFRAKYDCLSKEASNQLMQVLKPRLVVSGHTHRFCLTHHDGNIPEWTIPSFSWRNINGPSFLLARVSPSEYSINKCYLPNESTVIGTYIAAAVVIFAYAVVAILWPCVSPKLKRVCAPRKTN